MTVDALARNGEDVNVCDTGKTYVVHVQAYPDKS